MKYMDLRSFIGEGTHFPITTSVDGYGNPVDVFDREPRTLPDVLRGTREFGTRIAIRYRDEAWTFDEQWDEIAKLASAYIGAYGVKPGGRVAIAMRNYPEWSFAFWAAQMVGATAVPLNAWLTGEELRDLVDRSTPDLVIGDAERIASLAEAGMNNVPMIVVRDTGHLADDVARRYEDVLAGFPAEMPDVEVAPGDRATILFTSGTTSKPKGVPATHSNHINNMYLLELRDVAGRGGAAASETPPPNLLTWPYFHISGVTYIYWCALAGRTTLLMHKWDVDEALRLIRNHGVTSFSGPPLTSRQLVDVLAKDDSPVPLRMISWGGAGSPAKQVLDVTNLRGDQIKPSTGYGSTEATSTVASNAGQSFVDRPSSIGRPLPGFQVRVVDSEGVDVPVGEAGELWLRGASMVKEYLDDPAATAAAFVDGWFRTGDLCTMDEDGFLYVVGRLKDIVIRGGENVSAGEVENLIGSHPSVVEAAVIGFPHRELGEEVGTLVRTNGNPIDPDDLRAWVAERTAPFKVPSIIRFTDAPLPRNAAGKLDKTVIRRAVGIN